MRQPSPDQHSSQQPPSRDGQDEDSRDKQGQHKQDQDQDGQQAEAGREKRKARAERRGFRFFLAFLAVSACLVVAVTYLVSWDDPLDSRRNPETDDAYANGDYTPLSPRVPGYLRRLDVDDNQRVRAGQAIAELENDDYTASVQSAEADASAAQAREESIGAEVVAARQEVRQAADQVIAARAENWQAGLEQQRQRVLLPTALGLGRTVDDAAAAAARTAAATAQAEAQTRQRQDRVAVLEARRDEAHARLDVARAMLELARLRLGYTVLRAPRDGVVGTRRVRVGSLLAPGDEVVSIVPLDTVWVDANFTERQVTDMAVGQPAQVRFDMYPGIVLSAHVVGMSPLTGQQMSPLPPDNTTGNYTKVVQRVPVKIGLDDQAGVLHDRVRPGMSAIVRVLTRPAEPRVAPVVPVR